MIVILNENNMAPKRYSTSMFLADVVIMTTNDTFSVVKDRNSTERFTAPLCLLPEFLEKQIIQKDRL